MANVNDIVNVTATIETGGLSTRDFGITLFVTDDETLPSSDPLRIYSDLDGVAADFSETSAPYLAAQVYFAQSPFPRNFMVGRWITSDTAAVLTGNTLPDLSSITDVVDGGFVINDVDVEAMDFSGASSYSDVASIVETACTSAGLDVAVTYDSIITAIVITTNVTGATATLTYATAGTSTEDAASLLALREEDDASLTQGADAQTIAEAMENFVSINDIFYFITLDPAYKDTQTVIDLSTWVFDNVYMYFAESSDPACLETDDTSSIFAQLFEQESSRTAGDYTPATSDTTALVVDNLAVSSAARLSSVNFEGSNTLINPAFKNRPLIDPSSLTTSQTTELDRKRVNRFVTIGGGTVSSTTQNIYRQGYCFANNIWQDVRYGVDWLTNAIQVAVLDVLLTDDKVPQTIQGQALIQTTIESVCRQGVTNGLMAAGDVSDVVKSNIISITGNASFDGTLPLGYLVYPQALSTLSDDDRLARKLPPIYVWCKGSGAVNFIDIALYFNQ